MSGFANPKAAAEARRNLGDKLREERAWGERRRASIVRRQAELLVEIIDYRMDHAGFVRLPRFVRFLRHPVKGLQYLVARVRKAPLHEPHHGDLGERAVFDHSLGLAQRLFEIGDAFFVDHPDLPPLENNDVETSGAGESAHRLSGDAK